MADDYVLVFARWVHFSAAMVAFGSSLFPFYIGERRQLAWMPSRMFAILLACAVLFGASLWLYQYAAALSGLDQISTTVWVILTETSFGVVWLVRIASSLLLVAVALLGSRPVRTGLTAGLAAALLITSGWDGHVVGTFPWAPLNQALHLLMAGFWLGGLVPLAFTVGETRKGAPIAAQETLQVLRRYSDLAAVAVTLVALTGIANVWLVLGGLPRPATSYGRALTLKIALFGALLLVAAVNRFVLMRALGVAATERRALAWLSGTIGLEQVMGGAILLDVSSFGLIDPAS
jgi:putative copper resistance protein D